MFATFQDIYFQFCIIIHCTYSNNKMKQFKSGAVLLDKCLNHTRLHATMRQHGSIIINDVDIVNFARCYRNDLNGKEKDKLLEYLSQKYGRNTSKGSKDGAKYEQLFDLIMRIPDGLQLLVMLLNDVFSIRERSKALHQLFNDLSGYIRPCFTLGYLKLLRITIESSPEILDSVKHNDAIHPIATYQDLEMRFRCNRRCFALLHDELPQVSYHHHIMDLLTCFVVFPRKQKISLS